MKFTRFVYILLCVAFTSAAQAQIMDNGHKVDTLSMKDRISIRTNAFEWTLLTPNIGIEYDLSKLNYGHLALTLDARWNWETNNPYKTGIVYNICGARLGLKYYYRMRKYGEKGRYPQKQTGFFNKLLSCRTQASHHPTVAFYRGIYLSYNKYSIKFGQKGYQGKAATGGLSWGFVKPLYDFANGNSLDFEAGISAGLTFRSRTTYELERESNCYHTTKFEPGKLQLIPVVSDLRMGFVYRLGNYPSTKKYRWRYDCDLAYQAKYDEILAAEKARRDSITNSKADQDSIFKLFMRVYNEQMEILGKQNVNKDNKIKKATNVAAKTNNNADKKKKDKTAKQTKQNKKKEITEKLENKDATRPEDGVDSNGVAKPEETQTDTNQTMNNTDDESANSDTDQTVNKTDAESANSDTDQTVDNTDEESANSENNDNNQQQ